jgi:alkylated DNA nucleotide flippase Atl1
VSPPKRNVKQTPEPVTRRYEMVNVRPGYLMIEQENHTLARRSYFVAERTPPLEEYREGIKFWKPQEAAQTFQFDVRDIRTGEVVSFGELAGLLYYACCARNSIVHKMGDLAHDQRISLYVAITTESEEGAAPISLEKIRVLNALFNERLTTPRKKVLILPDLFGLHREITYGQIAIDFGLTSME